MGSTNQYKGYTEPDFTCPLCNKKVDAVFEPDEKGVFNITCSLCKKSIGTFIPLKGEAVRPKTEHLI